MHNSRLPLHKWALAFYLFNTSLKGVSSMKLHRDLEITQKTAWYLAHRIRETWNADTEEMAERFEGPVEADETYIGEEQARGQETQDGTRPGRQDASGGHQGPRDESGPGQSGGDSRRPDDQRLRP